MNALIGNTTPTIFPLDKATALANKLNVEAAEDDDGSFFKVVPKFGQFAVAVYVDDEYVLTL